MARFMDTLAELSGSSSDDDEAEEEVEDVLEAPLKKKRAAAKEPAPDDLEKLGYKSGPSILFVPEPQDSAKPNWEWGKGAKDEEPDGEESFEQRQHNRDAAGEKLEEKARLQRLAQQQARQAREEARKEQIRLAEERRLTFKQKEKRKRELGQAKGGKGNYVEEEKRVARQFGVYSGFDS